MKKWIIFLFLFLTPAFIFPLETFSWETFSNGAEMWWCSHCGLAYPASQKFCLNRDCPLFRKGR